MVASEDGSNDCLRFCLEGTKRNLVDWGHEYLQSLSGHISQEYNKRTEAQQDVSDLNEIVDIVIPNFMKQHEEPEAVDLLMEVENLDKLLTETTVNNYERVCLYLLNCASYAADPEEMMKAFKTAY